MKLKNFTILFSLFTVLLSCVTTQKATYWVDSIKVNCDIDDSNDECLRIFKGEDISKAEWENFYGAIEGFEFEKGYLKKIQVKEKRLKKNEVFENDSAIKYIMIKEIQKERDDKGLINGEWILAQMNESDIDVSIVLPHLKISTTDLMLSGKGGCNNYSSPITTLTSHTLAFGPVMSTRMACHNNNIESKYLQLLNTTAAYEIEADNLILFNRAGERILSFSKAEQEVNPRLHDIWFGLRIDKAPIKRLEAKPRLEINLTNQQVYGFDGCNEFGGSIKNINKSTIEFGDIASTLIACENMNSSEEFNIALHKVATYQLKGLELIFFDQDGVEVLAFMKGD